MRGAQRARGEFATCSPLPLTVKPELVLNCLKTIHELGEAQIGLWVMGPHDPWTGINLHFPGPSLVLTNSASSGVFFKGKGSSLMQEAVQGREGLLPPQGSLCEIFGIHSLVLSSGKVKRVLKQMEIGYQGLCAAQRLRSCFSDHGVRPWLSGSAWNGEGPKFSPWHL